MNSPPSPIPLKVDNVSRHFGDFYALKSLSLEIEPGEIFALLGPNGAGKTTLISCISGLGKQSSGEIRVFGYDNLSQFRQARRLVGVVPQEINFDPFFTPHESLMIQMGLMGLEPDARRADELLEMLSLSGKRDAYSRHLSGGMKRRLLIAKALVHSPKLLFLDEPTAGVDVELRNDLWREIKRLQDEGTTIILTTHYLEEAELLADRIGVLRRGELIALDDKTELMSKFQERELIISAQAPISELPAGFTWPARVEDGALVVTWDGPAQLEEILRDTRKFMDINDVSTRTTSLEDVFIKLTSEGAAAAASGEVGR